MLSVTSYSENPAVTTAPAPKSTGGLIHWGILRKNLSRFWPLWAVYAIVMLLAWPVAQFISVYGYGGRTGATVETAYWLSSNMLNMSGAMGLYLGALAAPLFALAVFAYLCNARALSMFHSFPVRRETLFLTNYLSGLLCFIPAVVLSGFLAALVQMSTGGAEWGAIGLSMLLVIGQTVFFYSLAVFCAMFTGQILAMPVFYAILNFLVVAVYYMVQLFVKGFYFGYSAAASANWVEWFTPLSKMESGISTTGGYYMESALREAVGMGSLGVNGLGVLGAYLVVALVMSVLALLVYRVRRSESAGEIVVLGWAKELFRYGVGVCAALSLGQGLYYLVWQSFVGNNRMNFPAMLVFCVALGVLGYYVAEMLIRKSFRVLRRGCKGAACMTAVLVLFGLAVNFDLLGVEHRVPGGQEIAGVRIGINGGIDYFNAYLQTEEGITMVRELHQAIVAEKDSFVDKLDNNGYGSATTDGNRQNAFLYIDYSLENGSSFSREYSLFYSLEELAGGSPAMAKLAETISNPVVQRTGQEIVNLERFIGGELTMPKVGENGVYADYVSINADEAEALDAAIQKDIAAGNFGRNFLDYSKYNEETYANTISITYVYQSEGEKGVSRNGENRRSYELKFSKNATNLLAALEELGLVQTSELTTLAVQNELEGKWYDGEWYNEETTAARSGTEVIREYTFVTRG